MTRINPGSDELEVTTKYTKYTKEGRVCSQGRVSGSVSICAHLWLKNVGSSEQY